MQIQRSDAERDRIEIEALELDQVAKAEDVGTVRGTIGPRLGALPKKAIAAPVIEGSLVEYVASFGIAPQELSDRDWLCFHAARELAHYVADIELPVATISRQSGEKVQVERKITKTIEETEYTDSFVSSQQPTDTFDVVAVKDPTDLPLILPTQWLLEDIAPEQFDRALLNRELLRTEWQATETTPVRAERVVEAMELVWENAPPTIKRPNAYTLLDCSPSMDAPDGLGVAGAGLSIAFFKKALDQGARMFASTFSYDADPPVSGTGKSEVKAVLRTILDASNGSGTDIQRSLSTAIRQIRKQGSDIPSDILLITDGESSLDRNPLGGIKLHVLLVGTLFSDESSTECHKMLKSWSTTFKRVNEQLDTIPLEHKDIDGISKATDIMAGQLENKDSKGIRIFFDQAGALLRLLKQNSNYPTTESEALRKKLQALRQALKQKHEIEKTKEEIIRKKQEKARKEQADKELEAIFDEEVSNAPDSTKESSFFRRRNNALPSMEVKNSVLDLMTSGEMGLLQRIKNWFFGVE